MRWNLKHRFTLSLLALVMTACSSVETAPIHQEDRVSSEAPQTTTSPNTPPFELTAEQLFAWSPTGPTADSQNRSTVALAPRFVRADESFDPPYREGQRVLYAPDGMNNFGNYLTPRKRFNLYTFTQWSQIDILNWFASGRVSIPSRPWVEAAHRNGVKVIGTVFFGPLVYGGSSDALEEFLIKDESGGFPAADKLVEIADFYGFDGWLMNQETDIPDLLGRPGGPEDVLAFMKYLTAIAPEGMEIHWYDSMLETGDVKWQNSLNQNNVVFLEDRAHKSRASDAIFLNYWWDEAELAETTQTVKNIDRAFGDVFWGADLWPERPAQTAFTNTDWLSPFMEDGAHAWSIALFAPNLNYNFSGNADISAYSDFATDPDEHQSFYTTQNRLFIGDDANAASLDVEGRWKGMGALVPSRSTISSLPFRTHFNTGHGLQWFENGVAQDGPWHDMSRQDVQPSWQFAHVGGQNVQVQFDFERAFTGGSSLRVTSGPSLEEVIIPLFRTSIAHSGRLKLKGQLFGDIPDGAVGVCIKQAGGETVRAPLNSSTERWQATQDVVVLEGRQSIARIDLCVAPTDGKLAFSLGMLEISSVD